MSLIKIEEGTYYYPFDDRYLRPSLFYIQGSRKSLAVDAGNSKMHREDFFKELQKNRLREPDIIVLTHCHWDHTLGLHDYKGLSFATRQSKDRLAEFKEYTWTKDSLIEMTKKGFMSKFSYLFMRKVYRNHPIVIPEIQEVYGEKMDIDLGGRTVRLIKTKTPHCEDATILWMPEEKIVIVGDGDYPSYKNNIEFYDTERTVSFCDRIEKLPFEYYCGSHKRPLNRKEGLRTLEELRKKTE
ncbi:MAG: MBL fold metallo-hydrolase [Gallicola sp.]|nr:MBL fold metallo-hydrolase [Gallicola sp.]